MDDKVNNSNVVAALPQLLLAKNSARYAGKVGLQADMKKSFLIKSGGLLVVHLN